MLAEVNIFGVFVAPIAIYAVISFFLTHIIRTLLWRLGVLNWFWHVALAEIALYVCILCLLVIYF